MDWRLTSCSAWCAICAQNIGHFQKVVHAGSIASCQNDSIEVRLSAVYEFEAFFSELFNARIDRELTFPDQTHRTHIDKWDMPIATNLCCGTIGKFAESIFCDVTDHGAQNGSIDRICQFRRHH